MNKHKFSFRNIPGWAVMLAIFGVLYLTGLHTEAIGQVQRLLLATGLKNASMPEPVPAAGTVPVTEVSVTDKAAMVGTGFKMTNLDGKTVSFESLRGKVVFLNIWATWCPPCVAEMPNIQRLYEKVGSDKIAFVMLSVDEGGQEKVQKFINKKGYTFPVYMPASQFPQEFYSNAIPTTFIISPEDKIVAKQEGMAEYDTPEVREFLKSMVR
ncbi:TlpA disulfide reductase family protein [Pontibacter beigongshangensis]|uniref:TlpA disulfide reductase family protein n=1 Tax=Pontibacter beigongshangensis TaxID=2574733 RepID=UPI00164FB3BD|nr:TlpA family protein disulfide reductase [Pontibacter beigongshangensis]